jgi:hypothetical protein
LLEPAQSCLVRARFVLESEAAIAVDQLEVKDGQTPAAALLLPPGEFNIDVQDGTGVQLRILKAKMEGTRK